MKHGDELKQIGKVIGVIARRNNPRNFRGFFCGVIIGNVVGNLSDEYWREFMKIEICDEPGCNCHEILTTVCEALDKSRDDWKKTMASREKKS